MYASRHILRDRYRQSASFIGRIVSSVALSIVLILGQAFPAMAGNGAADSFWVEICAEGDSYFMEIELGGEIPSHDCEYCAACLAANADAPGFYNPSASMTEFVRFETISFLSAQQTLVACPEQYWSACRGPPITHTESNMTIRSFSPLIEARGLEMLTPWRTPWV